jgi:hypothetical protein
MQLLSSCTCGVQLFCVQHSTTSGKIPATTNEGMKNRTVILPNGFSSETAPVTHIGDILAPVITLLVYALSSLERTWSQFKQHLIIQDVKVDILNVPEAVALLCNKLLLQARAHIQFEQSFATYVQYTAVARMSACLARANWTYRVLVLFRHSSSPRHRS